MGRREHILREEEFIMRGKEIIERGRRVSEGRGKQMKDSTGIKGTDRQGKRRK
jgi:hypothetical protein